MNGYLTEREREISFLVLGRGKMSSHNRAHSRKLQLQQRTDCLASQQLVGAAACDATFSNARWTLFPSFSCFCLRSRVCVSLPHCVTFGRKPSPNVCLCVLCPHSEESPHLQYIPSCSALVVLLV